MTYNLVCAATTDTHCSASHTSCISCTSCISSAVLSSLQACMFRKSPLCQQSVCACIRHVSRHATPHSSCSPPQPRHRHRLQQLHPVSTTHTTIAAGTAINTVLHTPLTATNTTTSSRQPYRTRRRIWI